MTHPRIAIAKARAVPYPRLLAALALLALPLLSSCGPLDALADGRSPEERQVLVTRVVDGDTVEISPPIDGITEVRLIGVDTPETRDPSEGVEPHGPEASAFAEEHLEGRRARLEFDEERTYAYARLLAYIHLNGEMFNLQLVRHGHAQAYPYEPNTRHAKRIAAAQRRAKAEGLGIWGLPIRRQCELADRGNGIGEHTPACVSAGGSEATERAAPGEADPHPAGADLDCRDFPTQAEAQQVLDADPRDPHRLDGAPEDGSACERLP